VTGGELLAGLLPSPLYVAERLREPTGRVLTVQLAAAALTATEAQPAMLVAPLKKATLPVGDVPSTVAVSVTLLPKLEGFGADVSEVIEVAKPTTDAPG